MSFTGYLRYTTGSTLYVKPLPLDNAPWSTGVITGTENGALGSYAFTSLTEGTDYEVFLRAGGSPASTDLAVGGISYASPLTTASLANLDVASSTLATQLTDILSIVESIAITGSPTYIAVDSYTLATGSLSSGGIADTNTADGVSHVHTDTAGAMQVIYDFAMGAGEIGVELLFRGRINSANDSIAVQAYDWIGADWETLWTQSGVSGSVDTSRAEPLLTKHTGTGGNDGEVRIRFYAVSGLSSATLYVDQLLVAKTVNAPTATEIANEVQTRTIAAVTTVATTTNLTNLPTMPADWVTAAGLAASAVTEMQAGLATAANLATVAGYLDTEMAASLAILVKMDTMLVLDGAVYQYTANALELAPSGGSGLTAAQTRAALGMAAADLDDQLDAISAKTALIGTGSATVSSPVADDGTLSAIVIGDDYLDANDRAFVWTVDSVTGVTIGTCTCWFGGDGGALGSWLIDGTLTDLGGGSWQLSFDLLKTDTDDLNPGLYDWSVAVHDASGNEITRVRSATTRVQLVRKYT